MRYALEVTSQVDSRFGSTLRIVWVVLLVGLLWRAVICFAVVPIWQAQQGVGWFPDHYNELAQTLLDQGTLGFGQVGATPTTLRGPGFAAWLAMGLLAGGSAPGWLGFWTSLPGLLAASLVGGLLARRYGNLAAVAGGLTAALHPLPTIIAARSMSDEFHAALGWGALALTALTVWSEPGRDRTYRWALLGGGLMAWHLLTRSSGLLTLVAIVLLALLDRPRRRGLVTLVLVAMLAILPALAWSVRTSRLEQRPVFVQSLVGYNFWLGEGFHRFGTERTRGEHYLARIELILEKAGLDPNDAGTFHWPSITPAQSARMEPLLQRAALHHVLDDPLNYAHRVLIGIYGFWTRAATIERTWQYRLLTLPFLLLAAWGAASALRNRNRPDRLAQLALLTILLHNLAYAAIVAMARNSVQVYPALGYLVGLGVADVIFRIRSRR